MITAKKVNQIGAQFNCSIYRVIDGHGVMVQMAEQTESWICLWNAGWHETESAALNATYQHLKECEQMNIFSTNLFPYLEGLMIKDKPVTMTIKSVTNEEVTSNRGKEIKTTIHFVERDKALILNKTNAKQIVKFFGGETNDWKGKKITLYAEKGTWFGVEGYAVRVDGRLPKQDEPKAKQNGTAPEIVERIVEDAISDYDMVTAEQAALLAVSDPGAFD